METKKTKKTKKALSIQDTELLVWQERDRLTIELRSEELSEERYGTTLVEWIDDAAREAVQDGFLDVATEAILGSLRHVRQGGALHRSAFEFWRDTLGSPKRPVRYNRRG